MTLLKVMMFVVGFSIGMSGCSDDSAPPESTSAPEPEGQLIPRTAQERAQYYLISVERDGEFFTTLHSRISSMSRGFSLTRIDCRSRRYQDLGYGDDDKANVSMYSRTPQWTNLVRGSSKYDLVNFVCSM